MACTAADTCDSGFCKAGKPKACPDHGPCVTASCNPANGLCLATAVTAATACDDGDKCTGPDACAGGLCKGGKLSCDDANMCTTDACAPATGCAHTALAGACDDGDKCTAPDVCAAGKCKSGAGKDCDDGKPCTTDACAAGVCKHAAATGTKCDDGTACTAKDACKAGACVGTPDAKLCADGSACTIDTCLPNSGCHHALDPKCAGCKGTQCLACGHADPAKQSQCGTGGAKLKGTCCAVADPLIYLAKANGDEVVDVELVDDFVLSCGGFGVRMSNVKNPAMPQNVGGGWGSGPQRCQRMTAGAKTADGGRIVYITHHGDDWVKSPQLGTWKLSSKGTLTKVDMVEDPKVLFEGVRWRDGHLYVAAHKSGVRTYQTDNKGKPAKLLAVTGGFTNAWKIELAGKQGYVADAEGGLRVLDLSAAAKPKLVQSLKTTGMCRDVDVDDQRLFAALGGAGIDVFARDKAGQLKALYNVPALGSAQALSLHKGLLAVANWSHTAVYDAASMTLLGTERVKNYPAVEQDFGVVIRDGIVYVGEWEGVHMVQVQPGRVAPDLWIKDELLNLKLPKAGAKAARVIIVENRGLVPLSINKIDTDQGALFSASPNKFSVAPGGKKAVELTIKPTGTTSQFIKGVLRVYTNDPDSYANPYRLHLLAQNSTTTGSTHVGDPLPKEFGVLDPTGAGQLSNLKGNVVVLAYFALF